MSLILHLRASRDISTSMLAGFSSSANTRMSFLVRLAVSTSDRSTNRGFGLIFCWQVRLLPGGLRCRPRLLLEFVAKQFTKSHHGTSSFVAQPLTILPTQTSTS